MKKFVGRSGITGEVEIGYRPDARTGRCRGVRPLENINGVGNLIDLQQRARNAADGRPEIVEGFGKTAERASAAVDEWRLVTGMAFVSGGGEIDGAARHHLIDRLRTPSWNIGSKKYCTSSTITCAPAFLSPITLLAKLAWPPKAAANAIEAPSAVSWMIWAIARPSSVPFGKSCKIVVFAGRSSFAMSCAMGRDGRGHGGKAVGNHADLDAASVDPEGRAARRG